jgi:WD40 repeat protein
VQRSEIIQQPSRFIGKSGDKYFARPVHVDFLEGEISYLRNAVQSLIQAPPSSRSSDPNRDLIKHFKKARLSPTLLVRVDLGKLEGRDWHDVRNYLLDLERREVPRDAQILVLQGDEHDAHGRAIRDSRLEELLFMRSIGPIGRSNLPRRYTNFVNEFKKTHEDNLELRVEWTDCAGDIITVVWSSGDAFICGTTNHSDSRNQQYNKAGNLVLGSAELATLRGYPEHRIVRPIVESGDNASSAMRESQDPWLYCSVAASSHDPLLDITFTAGFDRTARVWKVSSDGSAMTLLVTWPHDGNVNFVVAPRSGGIVATATDVPSDAVRIYQISNDVSESTYQTFSCSRVDEHGNATCTDKWAYFPATVGWGRGPGGEDLLLVGYSPRSVSIEGTEEDIPEDRRNSGEICMWDGRTHRRWKLLGQTRLNTFEIAWHPSQAAFAVATSKGLGKETAPGTNTQIWIYRPSNKEPNAFFQLQVLDCQGLDINELAIRPNSVGHMYVAAGCTDGKIYVWDSGRGDDPIHVLNHGAMVEEQSGEVLSVEDTGIKFLAWGSSADRLYTGSSDGVVKVWDVRSSGQPLVRDLLECPGPVSCGSFSPDFSKLVIGDGSGRVFLLTVDDDPDSPLASAAFTTLRLPDGSTRSVRRPRPLIRHPDPQPPTYDAAGNPFRSKETGTTLSRAWLDAGALTIHRDPTIGAVQGPKYASLNMWRRELHAGGDPSQPLIGRAEALQQRNVKMEWTRESRKRPADVEEMQRAIAGARAHATHAANRAMDLDLAAVEDAALLKEIARERVNEYDGEEALADTELDDWLFD